MYGTLWVLLAACNAGEDPMPIEPADPPPLAVLVDDADVQGLRLRLFDAEPEAAAGDRVRSVPGDALSDSDLDALLSRVEPLAGMEGDRTPFAQRAGSPPPPLSGSQVDPPFPPAPIGDVSTVAAEPLSVLRWAPAGEVPLAPHVSLTFSAPMVAVTSHTEVQHTVPVTLDPKPPGRWRWLGTRTLLFDPEPRMPMATAYTVEVPGGTESATGEPLAEPLSFTFETPPVQIVDGSPGQHDPVALQPVVTLAFDQAVDAQAIADIVRLEGSGAIPLRLATDAEVAADPLAIRLASAHPSERVVALRPVSALPTSSTFAVQLPAGTPSAEGPLLTRATQGRTFTTFSTLKLDSQHCNWDEACRPTSGWYLDFNNPLDVAAFDPSMVTVDPPVPGLSVHAQHDAIQITGAMEGRTKYTVTVSAALSDTFGQTLGRAAEAMFDVGPADRTLGGPGDHMVVLDPAGPAAFTVWSTNYDTLKVRVHRVTPDHWSAWIAWLQRWQYESASPGAPPGELLHRGQLTPAADPDALVETAVDLSEWVDPNGHGQFIVVVEQPKASSERWQHQMVARWVQRTDLGLTAFSDADELVGWATELRSGAPVEGAVLTVQGTSGAEPTGSDGLTRMPLPLQSGGRGDEHTIVIGKRGTDIAVLPAYPHRWGHRGFLTYQELDQLRWYVTDDRGLYKPGETARVFGYLRRWQHGPTGDVVPLDSAEQVKVHWQLMGGRGNELGTGEVDVSPLGGFQLEAELPSDANLGTAQLILRASNADVGGITVHNLQIQEFRRPEFEVTTSGKAGPHVLGQQTQVAVDAAYFAGGGLAGADVSWNVHASPATYAPPGHGGYSFGTFVPWWRHGGWGTPPQRTPPQTWSGTTDASGTHPLGIHFEAMAQPRPMTVRAEATVLDVNRQAWTSGTDVLVHPAQTYIGLKSDRTFVERGEAIDVEAKVVSLDGAPLPGISTTLTMSRVEGRQEVSGYVEEHLDPSECLATSDANGALSCSFETVRGGSYRVLAEVEDSEGRRNTSELRIWVSGAELQPARHVELEALTLVPEVHEVAPGGSARVLLQSPFFPAEGTLTLRRSGLVEVQRFQLDAPTRTFEIPITDAHVPDLTVQFDLVGTAPRADDAGKALEDVAPRVAHATGTLTFQVPPLRRTLAVEVTPDHAALSPGAHTGIAVAVHDADGAPVADAELAVVVVDEAILSLTGFTLPDPIAVFYAARGPGVNDHRLRTHVALASPAQADASAASTPSPTGGSQREGTATLDALGYLGEGGFGRGAGMLASAEMEPPADGRYRNGPRNADKSRGSRSIDANNAQEPNEIALRTDFSATALFAPAVRTDASGHASVALDLPDSLTRYRVMVVAVDAGHAFGRSDASITAQRPLMVRPSAPRFLNFGDQLELPVVLQNLTDVPMTVDVGVRATNLTFVNALTSARPDVADASLSSAGRRVQVPANDRVEVRFPAATLMAGRARLQAVAASTAGSDAAAAEWPVWTPATTEAFATYGEIDDGGIVQPVAAPDDVWTQFGGLEVTTSSTQLQALTDAVLYLQQYPYACNEQLASRVLAIASLRDVLDAFEADGLPKAAALDAQVQADLERLESRQNPNGGVAFWRHGDRAWPMLSIHVANAYARARAKGYTVSDAAWSRSLTHLQQIESHIPSWYSRESRWFLRAYALDVLRRMGDPDARKARALLSQAGADGLGVDGMSFLLPTLTEAGSSNQVTTILRALDNRVTESARDAHFVTGTSDGAHVLLHSDRRGDGIALEALVEAQPTSDLIPKVVRGLLGHRVKGRWGTTQENAFVLLALDRYFRVFEAETPDFVARVWLGNGSVGEHAFEGRTTERAHFEVPMGYLTESADAQPLTVVKDGDDGRLYYRIGVRYATQDLRLSAEDQGFAVERLYEAVDDSEDVRRDDDGTWHIAAGARVRVRLTMATPMRRTHVALVDPIPAGLEAVNPALATSGSLPDDPTGLEHNRFWWWTRTWYEHENMRDERVEAFTSLLWDGVHTYTYIARATTPGRFVVPPPRAEEMYAPETFGHGATDVVVVDP